MDNKKSNNRRKILLGLTGSIVGASQLSKSWTKPVVNAVLLPTHAQTTETDSGPVTPTPPPPPPPLPTAFSGKIVFTGGGTDNTNPENKVLSFFVAEAHAGVGPAATGQMCITVDSPGGNTYTTMVSITDGFSTSVYEGNGTIGGGVTMLSPLLGCFDDFNSPTIDVTNVTAAGAEYTATASSGSASGTLPEGTDCPDTSECSQEPQ